MKIQIVETDFLAWFMSQIPYCQYLLIELYVKDFRETIRNGRGRLIHADVSVYEGEWENDKIAWCILV